MMIRKLIYYRNSVNVKNRKDNIKQYGHEAWKRKHFFTSWDLVNLFFYYMEEVKSMMTGSTQSQSISYVKDI